MKQIFATFAIVALFVCVRAHDYAHSFQEFYGPVTGEEKEVTWTDKNGVHRDWIGHPHYDFAYGVEDHKTGEYQGRKEHRDGKGVIGEYTIKEPSGNIRTVKYHADDDGFHAEIHNSNGHAR